jgi:hypothetical protein
MNADTVVSVWKFPSCHTKQTTRHVFEYLSAFVRR